MQKNKLNWKLYAVVFFIIALALLHHYGTTYTGFAASAPEKNVAVEANITTGKTNSTILPTASTSTTSSNEEEQAFTILAGESSGNQITSFALPLVENVTLNATSPQNLTSDNLTLHFDVFDADGDSVKNITDWRLWNGTDFESIAVLNMPFENHSSASSTAIDYSTFGNNGTVVSAVFNATGGKDGKGAYTFTSSGNQIIVPDSSELSFGNGTQDFPFTITAWINAKSTSGNPIISKYSSGEPGVPTNAEYVLQLAAGKLFLHLFNGGSISANIGAEGSSTLSTNQWYFIAASYDGSSLPNGIKLYVNGVEESVTTSSAGSYVAMNNTSQNVTIGRLFSGSESTFNGEIDGLQVFHLNLSGKQIQTLYENRTNLIINEETSIDETWQACVTPNDGFSDGTRVCSNNITIQSDPNTCVNLSDSSTYGGKIINNSNTYYVVKNTTLCTDTYQGFNLALNTSGILFDGNNSLLNDSTTGIGIEITANDTVVNNTKIEGYAYAVRINPSAQRTTIMNVSASGAGTRTIDVAGNQTVIEESIINSTGSASALVITSTNNTVNNTRVEAGITGIAIRLIGADFTTIKNTNATSGFIALAASPNAYNNTFDNLILNSTTSSGVAIIYETNVENNTFSNSIVQSAGSAIQLQKNSSYNTVENITLLGTPLVGVLVQNNSHNNTFSNIELRGVLGAIGILLNAQNQTFNNITISSPLVVQDSASSTFNNLVVDAPFNVSLSNASTTVMNNVTFASSFGKIFFNGSTLFDTSTQITDENLNISFNSSFVNSSNLTFLNRSAQVTLYNLNANTLDDLDPLIDTNDDGTFSVCSDCVEISLIPKNGTLFSDNFNDGSINANWSLYKTPSATAVETGGLLNLSTGPSVSDYLLLVYNTSLSGFINVTAVINVSAATTIPGSALTARGIINPPFNTTNITQEEYPGALVFSKTAAFHQDATPALIDSTSLTGDIHTFTVTYNTTSGVFASYVDGTLLNTSTFTATSLYPIITPDALIDTVSATQILLDSASIRHIPSRGEYTFNVSHFTTYAGGGVVSCVNLSNPATFGDKVQVNADQLVVRKNASLCAGTYNIQSTNSNPLLVNMSHGVFDCNNSLLNLSTTNPQANLLSVFNQSNVTLQNCAFQSTAGALLLNNVSRAVIINNTWENVSGTAGLLFAVDPLTFKNNRVSSENTSYGSVYGWFSNALFENNTFEKAAGLQLGIIPIPGFGSITIANMSNNTVQNNIFKSSGEVFSLVVRGNDTLVQDNFFNNSFASVVTTEGSNITILNNTLLNTFAQGVISIWVADNSSNILVADNTILGNITTGLIIGLVEPTFPTSDFVENISVVNNVVDIQGVPSPIAMPSDFMASQGGVFVHYADNVTFENNSVAVKNQGPLMEVLNATVLLNDVVFTPVDSLFILNQSTLNFTNVLFNNSNGSVFFPTLNITRSFVNVTEQSFAIDLNKTFVNSSELPEFNASAQLTFRGLQGTLQSLSPLVDENDDGVFTFCSDCVEISYSPSDQTYVFNVSHFTTYAGGSITNTKPNVTSITLNSSLGTNTTLENLALYFNVTDGDGDNITNITDWRLWNGTDFESWALLNLPIQFNGSGFLQDFSTHGYSVQSASGASFSNTSGHDGFGAVDMNPLINSEIEVNALYDDIETKDITILMWIRPDNVGGGTLWAATPFQSFSAQFSGARIQFVDSITSIAPSTSPVWQTGQWQHLAYVSRYQLGEQVEAYRNGVLVMNVTRDAFTRANSGTHLRFGRREDAYLNRYDGKMDHILVFDKALTPEQIKSIYENQKVIVNQETSPGDIWQACVTPNDGKENGLAACSENLTVLNTITVTLNNPANNTALSSTSPTTQITFNWSVFNNTQIATCNLTLDGSIVATLNVSINASNQTTQTVGSGTHYWNVTCTAQNTITSETRQFTYTQTSSGGGGGGGPPPCDPQWTCTQWSECINGAQTRTCTDINSCGTTSGKPGESQSCTQEQEETQEEQETVQTEQTTQTTKETSSTKSFSNSLACIQTQSTKTPKIIEKEINFTQLIPQGTTPLLEPITVDCVPGSSITLDLVIPENYVDIGFIECVGSDCLPQTTQKVTQLICDGQVRSEQRETIEQKPATKLHELQKLNVTITQESAFIGAQGIKVAVLNDSSARIQLRSPTQELPPAANKALSIVGTPIEIELHNTKGTLDITLPYEASTNASSVQAFALVQKDPPLWVFVGGEQREQGVHVVIENPQELAQDDILTLALMETICTSCDVSELKLVHTPPQPSRDAVLLIHGLAASPETFNAIINDIRVTKQPWQAWTFGYPSDQIITLIARDLANQLETQQQAFDNLYVVAHSLGGIIAQEALRYAYDEHQKDPSRYSFIESVRKVILIGTPNKGSPGADLYKNLYTYLANFVDRAYPLSKVSPDTINLLTKGEQIERIPNVDYYVIAGTKPIALDLVLFKKTLDLFEGIDNDGIVSTLSARLVGGEEINNQCENYWEIDQSHVDLLDDETSRKVIERIVAGQIQEDYTGKQFLRVTIDSCNPQSTYILYGKEIDPKAVADPTGCSCGNGVCGVDENPVTCPSDCLRISAVSALGREVAVLLYTGLFIVLLTLLAVALVYYERNDIRMFIIRQKLHVPKGKNAEKVVDQKLKDHWEEVKELNKKQHLALRAMRKLNGIGHAVLLKARALREAPHWLKEKMMLPKTSDRIKKLNEDIEKLQEDLNKLK